MFINSHINIIFQILHRSTIPKNGAEMVQKWCTFSQVDVTKLIDRRMLDRGIKTTPSTNSRNLFSSSFYSTVPHSPVNCCGPNWGNRVLFDFKRHGIVFFSSSCRNRNGKRRRHCVLPAHSKTCRNFERSWSFAKRRGVRWQEGIGARHRFGFGGV
jgi:hypothetical protein